MTTELHYIDGAWYLVFDGKIATTVQSLQQLRDLTHGVAAVADPRELPTTRINALKEIFAERESQDKAWRDSAFPIMNAQYEYAAPHVLVLEECVAKLRAIWYGKKDEGTLRERFVKVAAVALRALEEIKHTRG